MNGGEHCLSDSRFRHDQSRADNGETISARMSEWCAGRTCAEALAALEEASIVAGRVYSPRSRRSVQDRDRLLRRLGDSGEAESRQRWCSQRQQPCCRGIAFGRSLG
jgi:crotonobetainyl-CoA:carnitine CoA-transferase CaiB-like acyl-CoA transferase